MSIKIGSDLCSHCDTGKRTQRRPTRPQQKTPQYAASMLQKWAEETVQWTGGLNRYRRIASAYHGASPNSIRPKFAKHPLVPQNCDGTMSIVFRLR